MKADSAVIFAQFDCILCTSWLLLRLQVGRAGYGHPKYGFTGRRRDHLPD